MAHKRGLDGTYLTPTREECFAEFVKAIPELTISNEERQKITIENLEKKNSEYQIKNSEIKDLAQWLDKNPNLFKKTLEFCEFLDEKIFKRLGNSEVILTDPILVNLREKILLGS